MYKKLTFKKWKVELLIQMSKRLYKKYIFNCIFQLMIFKIVFIHINGITLLSVSKKSLN
jgi:hypothetical protein